MARTSLLELLLLLICCSHCFLLSNAFTAAGTLLQGLKTLQPATAHGDSSWCNRRVVTEFRRTCRGASISLEHSVRRQLQHDDAYAEGKTGGAVVSFTREEEDLDGEYSHHHHHNPPPPISAQEAKRELLPLLDELMTGHANINDDHNSYLQGRERIGYLLRCMELESSPIQTLDFLNFAIQGKWHLAFSTTRLAPSDPRLAVREFSQEIIPGGGTVSNYDVELKSCGGETSADGGILAPSFGTANVLVQWGMVAEHDTYGNFEVCASYNVNEHGHSVMKLTGHKLAPLGDKMPEDPVELVGLLQRVIPPEVFDPDGSVEETTYVDCDVRITKQHVGRLTGARHIYVRTPPKNSLGRK